MTCTVTHDKAYARMIMGLLIVALAADYYATKTFPGMPRFFAMTIAGILVFGLILAIINLLSSDEAVIRVDKTGIFSRRISGPVTLPWSDVVAVNRLSRLERISSHDSFFHLRDGWRPIEVSVRGSEKNFGRFQKHRRFFRLAQGNADVVQLRLEFMGLKPGSDIAYECIRYHLARQVAEGKRSEARS